MARFFRRRATQVTAGLWTRICRNCGPPRPWSRNFAIGERVAVFPLLWCGSCEPCETGTFAQCLDYDYIGSRRNGAFAEYVVAPTRNLIRVPTNVSLEQAALVEPAAVALHSLRRAGGCSIGECVAIFGSGPIGLMVASGLAQWRCYRNPVRSHR